MPHLIEIVDPSSGSPYLAVGSGDLLLVRASGCRVHAGDDVVDVLGVFVETTLGEDGRVVEPVGLPNVVLLRARGAGRAAIEFVVGDPFFAPRTVAIELVVAP